MAIRTDDEAVEAIIEVEEDDVLTPFIEAASFLVDRLLVDATDSSGNIVHDSTSLELVERWLAAHFYAVRKPRASSERAGPVGETLMHKVDLNLSVTMYGQQAMLIDVSGELAAWNADVTQGKTKTATSVWLGKDPNNTLGQGT